MKKVILTDSPAVTANSVEGSKFYGLAYNGEPQAIITRVLEDSYMPVFPLESNTYFGDIKHDSLKSCVAYWVKAPLYTVHQFDTYKELSNWLAQ